MVLLALGAASAFARGGYVITQHEGGSRSKLVLAPTGLRFDALAPTRRRGPAQPQVGVIVRYGDLQLFLLDPDRRQYDAVSLATATAGYAAELKLAGQGQPSERLPPRPGAAPAAGQAALKRPAARLRALGLTTRIGPVRARAYLLVAGRTRQRLWYSSALPVPPRRVRTLLAKGLGSGAGGSFDRALSGETGRVPLRVDERRGKRWHTVLRTTSIRRATIRASVLKPPRGYHERNLLTAPAGAAPAPAARAADVPANALRCALVVNCFGALRGPISSHPDLYAFYWGTHYRARTDFVSSVNHALENFVGDQFADPNSKDFWGPLAQYGVGRGRLLGSEIVNENPDNSVGSWNFFDIDWFVATHRFGSDAPNYWWRFSDHDPIFAIFVDQSEVDSSGWAGYHFFTPTEGLLFAFLAHPNMPWLIVKTPDVSKLPMDRGSAAYQQAVDQTSERASHEFVEAATDPYPFLSWGDPLKEPIWENGELADICAQGNIAPFAKNTRVLKNSTALSTYWSNDDNACMPESRPSLSLALPTDGSTYTWGAQVTFLATGDDLFDGSVPDSHFIWTDDRDGQIGATRILSTTALTPGTHHVTVTVRNSQGGVRTAGPVTVTMVVRPPAVRIDEPPDGTTVGTDQKLNLRGSVFDPTDGDVSDRAAWSIDGVKVGTGAKLFSTQITTQGVHTVTLSYTNTGGLTGSASIKVNVGPPTGKPSVTITDPALPPGYTDRYVTPGVPFKLAATADAQGVATIPDSGYVWSSDLDGVLGTGPSIDATLREGTHHVTVTVTDSLHRTATDTVTIISQPPIG